MKHNYTLNVLAATAFACSLFVTSTVDAQINGPGISASADFDTVTNIPTDSDFGDDAVIGGVTDQTTQLNLSSGGSIGTNFTADFGSEVNVSGGNIGSNFFAANSEVNISDGNIEMEFTVANSAVNVSGGTIGGPDGPFRIIGGSVVDISDGFIDSSVLSNQSTLNVSGGSLSSVLNIAGGTADISGGNFGEFLIARAGSEVSISGGDFLDNPFSPFPAVQPTQITANNATIEISGGMFEGNLLIADDGGQVNFLGTEFFVGGVELDSLQPDDPFLVNDRNVELSGILLDGSAFSIFLNPNEDPTDAATVTVSTVSAVPEPSGLALLLAGGVVGLLVRRRK